MSRFTFDPTINAGHILTFLGFLATAFIAWNTMDKRVVVLEEAKIYQKQRDEQQDFQIQGQLAEIRQALRDINSNINDLRKPK